MGLGGFQRWQSMQSLASISHWHSPIKKRSEGRTFVWKCWKPCASVSPHAGSSVVCMFGLQWNVSCVGESLGMKLKYSKKKSYLVFFHGDDIWLLSKGERMSSSRFSLEGLQWLVAWNLALLTRNWSNWETAEEQWEIYPPWTFHISSPHPLHPYTITSQANRY